MFGPMTRRQHLKGAALAPLALGLAPVQRALAQAAAAADVPALRSLAAAKGLEYGSDSDIALDKAPPEYVALFMRQCALFAPEMSWRRISPNPGTYNFDDPSVDIALKNGLKLTGVHFLWHRNAPAWLAQLNRGDLTRTMTDFISRTASHYRGKVYSWNVSNEAINVKEGRQDGLRKESVFVTQLGQGYLVDAFHAARAADPNVLLAYNEYDLDLDTPDQEARRSTLLRLLDFLQRQEAPINAVGLQSHLKVDNFDNFNERRYRAFLQELASRGFKILITELDVFDKGAPSDIAKRDQIVADIYARFLSAALDERAVKSVVTWGLSDRYTWYTPNYSPEFARPDRLPVRALPFDADFRPKPAFWAIAKALQAAPAR
jgi:endo-1,4-beta-xylanase